MTEGRKKRKIELLAPAGSYETFQAVINAGADAVYLGGSRFGARAYADNFGEQELLEAIDYAHLHGRAVYLTVNTLLKERELEDELYSYLRPYYGQGLDAVILQDLGAFYRVQSWFPGLSIHTSTQMTVADRYGAGLMKQLGAARIVTAREMSFAEIKAIHDEVDIEIESFVHGALCYCYSGQCLLSSMLGGRSGNRGRCAQPCRLPYEAYDAHFKKIPPNDKKRKEEYILSPKDLCTVDVIPELVECGIDSFKIEGRMKQAEYAAGVVSVYRKYLDLYLECFERVGDARLAKEAYRVSKEDRRSLFDFGNRSGFTEGYYRKHNGRDMITLEKPNHAKGNEALWADIRGRYIQTESKEKIKGKLILFKDFPAKMEVSLGKLAVSVSGDIVQPAQRQPLSREKVESSIKKTGNTPYEFETLEIEMEPDVFLPVQSLNQLRREALKALGEEALKGFRRTPPELPGTEGKLSVDAEVAETGKPFLSVSIEERSQLAPLLSYAYVRAVYLDSACYARDALETELTEDIRLIRASGKEAYYVLPTVLRMETERFYLAHKDCLRQADGIVVKSLDALAFVRRELSEDCPVLLDAGLYTYNHAAKKLLAAFGPVRDTVPVELNRKELFGRDNRNSEIVLYGRLPLMTSAQCVHANLTGCDRKPTVTWLKDRYGKYFPVKNNCAECYNTVYNTAPLILFGFRSDFERMGLWFYRISFTIESEAQVGEIMNLYEKAFLGGEANAQQCYPKEYTNGHYRRGVE